MPDLQRSWIRTLQLPLAVSLALSVLAPSAMAQGAYKSDEVDASLKRYGTSAKRFARTPADDPQARTAFGNYVLKYYLPMMTQTDAKSLGDLSKYRYDFFRNFIWSADPSIQQLLTPKVMEIMSKVAVGREYHPSVRYNAILMIGLLDEKYSTGATPPEPLPAANELLIKVVNQGIENRAAPAPLVVGALVGLERHARVLNGLPAQNRTDTVAALMAVVQKDELPQEISRSVEQWIKVIAARGLANTGSLGDGNQVHEALLALLADEKFRLDNRVQVAALFDKFGEAYKSAAGIDENKTAQTLLGLASAVAADEKKRAEDYEEESLRGGGRSEFSDIPDMPDEYQVRRLVMRLRGLRAAFEAVAPAIKEEKLRVALDQVLMAIGPVLTSAEDKNVIELNLAGEVKLMADTIASTAESLGVEVAEEPAETDEALEEELLGN